MRSSLTHAAVPPLLVLGLVLQLGCGGDARAELARAQVDTLPSGIVSVSSSGPTGWADTSGWRLVETGRIAGHTGEAELIAPQSIAVDDAGRVYVADTKPAIIKVYDASGRFVRSFGREGEGPGEFRTAFIAVHGAHLVMHDPRNSRTSVFDTSGAFVRSWSSACCYWTAIQVDRDGLVYVPFPTGGPETLARWVRYRIDGTAVDTLSVPRFGEEPRTWTVQSGGDAMMTTLVPFTPRAIAALHPAGGFLLGWSGEHRYVRSPHGTDTALVFSRSWTAPPVPERAKEAVIERMIAGQRDFIDEATLRDAFKGGDVPATLPAYTVMSADRAGRVWSWLDTEEEVPTVFDLFDADGAYLGQVPAPARIAPYGPRVWTEDGMVVAMEDEDGMPVVVRYRVERGSD